MKKITVHDFTMGDVDDPEIYAAQPLYEWQQTDKGRWVMANSQEIPSYHIGPDPISMGYKIRISAVLREEDLTYFYLRWPK